MKIRAFFPVFVIAILLAYVSPANALFSTDVQKAKEFMTAGMYPQAIELLNKRINEKPTDAEAHFQLGVCYVNTGNFSRADERFGSAVKLNADYGYQIGGKYKNAGTEALNKGNTGRAQSLYQKAVQYQPNLKTDIAKECFSAGEKYLNEHQSNTADGLLSMAVKYDASLEEGKNRITQAYGEKLLAIAKDKPKNERRRYVDEAKKYLTQQDVDAVFPPPGWKTVFKKEYSGIGFKGCSGCKDDDNYDDGTVLTAENGKDYKYGDKIIVKGKNAEYYYEGGWKKIKNGVFTNINKSRTVGNQLGIKAPNGEKVVIEVQRYTTSH